MALMDSKDNKALLARKKEKEEVREIISFLQDGIYRMPPRGSKLDFMNASPATGFRYYWSHEPEGADNGTLTFGVTEKSGKKVVLGRKSYHGTINAQSAWKDVQRQAAAEVKKWYNRYSQS